MLTVKNGAVLLVAMLLFVGCSKKDTDSAETAVAETEAAMTTDDAYKAAEGDWLVEAHAADAMEGAEPLTNFLIKATGSDEGWSTKFTHIDDPVVVNNMFMVGDSIVTEFGPYASALREGATVEKVVSYQHYHGDEMSGRFVATYSDGEVLSGKLKGERVN